MSILLHLLFDFFTEQIERGSPRGALVGAVIGACFGAGGLYLLERSASIDLFWFAPLIVACVVAALIGGFIGSFFLVGATRLDASTAVPTGDMSIVRLTNFNRGLPPILFFAGVSVALLFVGYAALVRRAWWAVDCFSTWQSLAAIPIYIIIGIGAARAVIWVEIGRVIVVRRLFTSTAIPAAQITSWAFSETESRYTLDLELKRAGGRPIRAPLATERREHVDAVLQQLTAAPPPPAAAPPPPRYVRK